MFNLSDATIYQSSDVKSEGDYNLDTSKNRAHTECTCLEKENPQIKYMCTSVKELLGILESREGEATEEEDMSWAMMRMQ